MHPRQYRVDDPEQQGLRDIHQWCEPAPVVGGNTVKANGTGIYIDGNAVPVINGGNVIESNTGHGIYSAYSSPTIDGNTIRSNTYDGIYLDHVSGKGPKAYAVTGNDIRGKRWGIVISAATSSDRNPNVVDQPEQDIR